MDKSTFFSNARKTKSVEIDGNSYTIRKLRQGEVERMKREYASDDKALAGFRFITAAVVLNDECEQMFSDSDLTKLAEVDYEIVEGIANAAMEFSGLIKLAKKN